METLRAALVLYCMVCCINGTAGCDALDVNNENLEDIEIDHDVHTCLLTTANTSLAQCIQRCYYVSTCNVVNFAPSLHTCRYFDIVEPPITPKGSPEETWKAVNVSNIPRPTSPDVCSQNDCPAGEVCFNARNGPVCLAPQW